MKLITLALIQAHPIKQTHKVCKGCPRKGEQPIESFLKHHSNRDGRDSWFKDCQKQKREVKKRERRQFI